MQTVRYAKSRLVRFDAIRVYSYSLLGNLAAIKRAGVYKVKGTK